MVDRDNIPEVREGAHTPAGPEKEQTRLRHVKQKEEEKKEAREFAEHRRFPETEKERRRESRRIISVALLYLARGIKMCSRTLRHF